MYINAIAHYYPETVVPNEYFESVNGLTPEWIETRTGIRERRKAGPEEHTQTMALDALKNILPTLPYPAEEIELVVAATYSPHDTVATLGHAIQNALPVGEIPVVTVTSACSSLLNALEVAEGYFAMGKATKALVVVSEHNSRYANESDTKAGHLWGDGAAVLSVSKEAQKPTDIRLIELKTGGAAHVGKNLEGVKLIPADEGILMPNGRDVFIHAVTYMGKKSQEILERHERSLEDLTYFIPHQANHRISKKVAEDLGLPIEKVVSNIQYLGNTGCAGCGIALSEKWAALKPGDLIILTVFGGGYSFGVALLEAGGNA